VDDQTDTGEPREKAKTKPARSGARDLRPLGGLDAMAVLRLSTAAVASVPQVGCGDLMSFKRAFRRQFGATPSNVRAAAQIHS